MSYPHFRGHNYNSLNGGDNMQRSNWNSQGRDRVDETNLTLMELENNQRWVISLMGFLQKWLM